MPTTKRSTRAKRGTRPLLHIARPDIAEQALDPATAFLTTGSNKKVEWVCERGHQWTAPVHARVRSTSKHSGCPYCSGRFAIPGETDIATTHPELAAQLRNADPTTVTNGSVRKFTWECERGHRWTATVANRARRGSQCPYCAGRLAIPGETDIATTHPELAEQCVDADQTTLGRGSNKVVLWRCCLGHNWTATTNTRIHMNSGCPYCAGQRLLAGFNDLATRFPGVGAEARSVDPASIVASHKGRIEWECTFCPKRWVAKPVNRTAGRALPGCPSCRRSGYKVTEPAHLYLLTRTINGTEELKVGITNSLKTRLGRHSRYGWVLLDATEPFDGGEVLGYEQDFLRMLDRLNVPRGKNRSAVCEPGFTETWNAADYTVSTVHQIIKAVNQARTN